MLNDREDNLLSARIAADGQWRFPHSAAVPEKFAAAIIEFEDRRFHRHLGVDPVGIIRAIRQNLRHGKIVSGGSTLTMQTARLARKNRPRTLWQKFVEIVWATRMEAKYSKEEILALYASNAPFGGNVVGLDAASWRYYRKSPELLSWGEAATLAVLPNSPGLIHPGRNRAALRNKRNRLLDRLAAAGKIDALTCELAKEEELPDRPYALPDRSPHLSDRSRDRNPNARIHTTVDGNLQRQLNRLVTRHNQNLKANQIHNLAAIVLSVRTGAILAYAGNAPGTGTEHDEQVDIIKSYRSTGSILKPFLYAFAVQEGLILPRSLLTDVPTDLAGYKPENYHRSYDGRVPADRALIRSLNVPFVHLLREYGTEKFHGDLQKIGLGSITRTPDSYGLSLILGGAEGSLSDITGAYASMARTLNNFQGHSGQYDKSDFRAPHFRTNSHLHSDEKLTTEAPVLTAASIYATFTAMQKVERPNERGDWERFGSSRRVAWKTGTSFGFRDAWAVGVTPDYAVGVWAGNADGEGRPGCVGVKAAAPVLFDIFDLLPAATDWFSAPYDEMTEIPVCAVSGFRANPDCPADTVYVPNGGLRTVQCSYHRSVLTDPLTGRRVTAECLPPTQAVKQTFFVLPPLAEHYYRLLHPEYQPLPPFAAGCTQTEETVLQFIYPKPNTRIFIPKDLDGAYSRTVFSAAHRRPEKRIYWHLDEEYLGSTQDFHDMELLPSRGMHRLVLVDEDGVRAEIRFEVTSEGL